MASPFQIRCANDPSLPLKSDRLLGYDLQPLRGKPLPVRRASCSGQASHFTAPAVIPRMSCREKIT